MVATVGVVSGRVDQPKPVHPERAEPTVEGDSACSTESLPRMGGDDYEDSELGVRVVHYHQSKTNGNGGTTTNLLIGTCGALLLILVAITGFMWTSQINFQQTMIDRMARVETRLGLVPAPPP